MTCDYELFLYITEERRTTWDIRGTKLLNTCEYSQWDQSSFEHTALHTSHRPETGKREQHMNKWTVPKVLVSVSLKKTTTTGWEMISNLNCCHHVLLPITTTGRVNVFLTLGHSDAILCRNKKRNSVSWWASIAGSSVVLCQWFRLNWNSTAPYCADRGHTTNGTAKWAGFHESCWK